MRIQYGLALPLLIGLTMASVDAQTTTRRPIPSLTAARTQGINVDGVLDEADWAQVDPATNFVQFDPDEGEPATQRTEVRILYGASAIYVGAMLYDTEPDRIRQILSRRDETGGADNFMVGFV